MVVRVIIATKYTSMNGHEEARHELLRVLAHYMVLIGDRIGLLHCLTTKRRLVENCHNLWNKPGDFAWNYGNSSTKEVTEMSMSTESRPDVVHTLWRGRRQQRRVTAVCYSDNASLRQQAHQAITMPNIPLANNVSQQDTIISDPFPQFNAELPSAYDWLPDVWPDNSNLMTAMGTTKCGFCNANIPSDDSCQVCFGPNLLMAGGEDAILQADRGCTSPILDPDASDPEATLMDATSEYRASEPWQTESSVSNDQSRIPTRYREPQMAAHQPESLFHRAERFIPAEEDYGLGQDCARCEYSIRKRTMTQRKPIVANNTPCQSSEEQPKTLRFHQRCSICHSMDTRTVVIPELTGSCQHVQCSHCKLVYPEPWLFSPESWVCCQCGDGPKPASSPLAKPCGGRPQLSNTLGGYETYCRNGHWKGLV